MGRLNLPSCLTAMVLCAVACADPAAVRALLGDDPVRCSHYADEVVVYVRDLDLLRAAAGELTAEITLASDAREDTHTVNLAEPAQPPAIVMRKPTGAGYREATVSLQAGGTVVWTGGFELGPPIQPRTDLPLSGARSYIEPGMARTDAPAIDLPDMSALRTAALEPAERVMRVEDATVRVETEVNYPLVSANNNCAISLQTAHPDDPSRRSLYVPMKSQLFDAQTGRPTEVAHYLVEVPLDEAWLEGAGDLTVSLPPEAISVHTSAKTWPPGSASGTPILGNGSSGLGQLVGTVDVDERGRIYYSHTPPGVVRFDPHTAEYQVPPIDVDRHFAELLPSLDDIPDEHKQGELFLRWEGYKIIAIHRGRLFYAPIIQAVYQYADHTSFVFAGLLSMPVDLRPPRALRDDPAAFTAGLRFHAGSWPGCERSFFEGWAEPADRTRKLGRLYPREDGLYITAYQRDWGGPWRLQVDDEGNTVSFEVVDAVPRGPAGARRDSASGLAWWRDYGSVTMSRTHLDTILHGTSGGRPEGEIEVVYDAIAAMRLDPERYGTLLDALSGPSLAPAYMATPIPGHPDTVLGVAEYGYYLATFDLSRLDDGVITKRYLLRDLGETDLKLPLQVGLGPYGHTWWRDADGLSLYMGGYTGLTRLVWDAPDLAAGRNRMEPITPGIETDVLDDAGPGPIKRYRYMTPGLDGRLFLTGTHTAARAGTAYSGGLMSFVAGDRAVLDKISFMSRCYWTTQLRSRIVHDAGRPPTQQLFLGGGRFDEGYAFMLEPELVPDSRDPRLFVYDYAAGGSPRSLFGLSLPPATDTGGYADHAFDRTRHYLVILHGTSLLSFDVAANRFTDGLTLTADGPIGIVEFERPDRRLLRAPDDRLLLYAAVGENPAEATFHEVSVDEDGTISVLPYLTLAAEDPSALARTLGVVCAFVPDLAHGDGSCDLFLGVPSRHPGSDARVIRDFIEPRR